MATGSSASRNPQPATRNPEPGRRQRYALHRLPQRVTGLDLPEVVIVDQREERRKRYEMTGSAGIHLLSLRLEAELRKLFGGRQEAGGKRQEGQEGSSEAGAAPSFSREPKASASAPSSLLPPASCPLPSSGQAILLLNRRGYANYIACPDHRCGWLMHCEHCDATMVYHRDAALPRGGLVRCHHCTTEQLLPANCPACARKVTLFGLGTQRVEEELAKKFPGLRLLRMDSDAMRSGRDYYRSLESFRRGEIDVLIGTQIIAKGLDFPNVRLVGVISADTAMNLPDFRAGERTFQLIAQVAGRAGRGDQRSLVVVQSFNPADAAIQMAARHDYEGFARQELALRQEVGLPPATRMARIVVRNQDHLKCAAEARKLADHLAASNAELGQPVRLRGPMPCPIARIAGFHRQQIELLAAEPGRIQRLLTALRNARLLKSDAHTAVDVDPVSLM